MLNRIKNLVKFDQRRLDVALIRIRGKASLTFCFNVFLLGVNSLGYFKRVVKRVLAKLGLVKSPAQLVSLSSLPDNMLAQGFNETYRVLIICERSIPQCLRYRVVQKTEQLKNAGHHAKWIDWTEYFDARNEINLHDIIIFYRVPGYPASTNNIKYAKALNKIVIYDIDDLVFDKQELANYYKDHGGQLSKKDFNGVLKGADLYQQAIQLCDFVTTSTPVLKNALESIMTSPERVFIHPNGIDSILTKASESIVVKPNALTDNADTIAARKLLGIEDNACVLFYGSGSNTHDQDFDLIAPAVEKIMQKHADVKLMIVGYLTLPENLAKFSERVLRFPLMPVEQYLVLVKRANINLAPLVAGLFADCKSEIKWLEAAYLGVPSVVSNTDIYQRVVHHKETAMIADDADAWFDAIDTLVQSPELRDAMAAKAQAVIKQNYASLTLGQNLSNQFKAMIAVNESEGRAYIREVKKSKQRIVLVNVLYPPQAMGGATVIVKNIAEQLASRYKDEYEVFVLTTDTENLYSYQVNTYALNNVQVTAISVPKGSDIDYRYQDDTIKEMVLDYFKLVEPDFVHFHCIQHLTASILDSASQLHIPYFVTVHDSWWISQHQFLVDKQGDLVNLVQSDPIVALQAHSQGQNENNNKIVDAAEIIARGQFLLSRLNKASAVFAVSKYQQALYQSNGVNNVQLSVNGVDKPLVKPVELSADSDIVKKAWPSVANDKIILGYTGSVCDHKGYYFIKKAITELSVAQPEALKHIAIFVIDFNCKAPYQQSWGDVTAFHLPKLADYEMAEFYQKINVLVAPTIGPESFGLISREAILTGTFAVVSRSGGLAEVIDEGINGKTFAMNDANAFQSIISDLSANYIHYLNKLPTDNITNVLSVAEHIDSLVADYKQYLA